MEKMQAHVEGELHRAISVFIFNSKNRNCCYNNGQMVNTTPLSLWTNTCCSHPRPGETA